MKRRIRDRLRDAAQSFSVLPVILILVAALIALVTLETLKRLPPTDAGVSTAWATWTLVAVTVFVLCGSLTAVWWQVKCQRRIESAKMVLALRERYELPEMQRQRKRLSGILLIGNPVTHRDDGVLVIFDTVGLLTRRRILELEMVWYEFCWDIVRYWTALRAPVDQIKTLREANKDETLYEELEWLADKLLGYDANRRGISQNSAQPSVAEIQEFLNDERSLEVDLKVEG